MVSIALQPDITRTGDFIFRVGSMGEVEGRAGAKLVGDLLKKKSVVLLTIKTDFGKTVAAGFKSAADKFGFKILKEYEYSPGDRQFGPLVASVKADAPDLIYASGFYFTGAPLLIQLRAAGVEVPFVGAQSCRLVEVHRHRRQGCGRRDDHQRPGLVGAERRRSLPSGRSRKKLVIPARGGRRPGVRERPGAHRRASQGGFDQAGGLAGCTRGDADENGGRGAELQQPARGRARVPGEHRQGWHLAAIRNHQRSRSARPSTN